VDERECKAAARPNSRRGAALAARGFQRWLRVALAAERGRAAEARPAAAALGDVQLQLAAVHRYHWEARGQGSSFPSDII
jgi:hypothetical protein